jgi:hypothetical protein
MMTDIHSTIERLKALVVNDKAGVYGYGRPEWRRIVTYGPRTFEASSEQAVRELIEILNAVLPLLRIAEALEKQPCSCPQYTIAGPTSADVVVYATVLCERCKALSDLAEAGKETK